MWGWRLDRHIFDMFQNMSRSILPAGAWSHAITFKRVQALLPNNKSPTNCLGMDPRPICQQTRWIQRVYARRRFTAGDRKWYWIAFFHKNKLNVGYIQHFVEVWRTSGTAARRHHDSKYSRNGTLTFSLHHSAYSSLRTVTIVYIVQDSKEQIYLKSFFAQGKRASDETEEEHTTTIYHLLFS